MKVTKDNLLQYLCDNTPIDYTVQISDFDEKYFDVLAVAGGDTVHYRVGKEDGAIYEK